MTKIKFADFTTPRGESFPGSIAQKITHEDGSTTLAVVSANGWPLAKSINLLDYALDPIDGAVFIGDYSEHRGLLESLTLAGLVTPTGRTVEFGPFDAKAHEAKVNF